MVLWKSIIRFILITAVLFQAGQLLADSDPKKSFPVDTLQRLLEEGQKNNQGLRALEQKIAALQQEVRAAGTLDDPRFGFGLINLPADSFRFDQEPMTQKQITLAQRIPWFGKLDLKTRRAALNVVHLESVLVASRLTLVRNLSDAYYELGFVAASQEINARLTSYLDQIIRFAETRYASGKGLQQDVLQAQVEQSRLLDTRNILKRQRRAVEDRINALLNRNEYQPIPPPAPARMPDISLSEPDWRQTVLDYNPGLATRRIEIDQARVEIDLVRKTYFPDPDLRLAYGQRDADATGDGRADFFSASVVFTLPVWAKNKQDRRLDGALKRRDAAQSQYQDLASSLPHRLDAMVTELGQLRENYDLYQEAIVVQARQWAESAMFSYEVGKVDFSAMISAQLRVLKFELQAKQYLFQFYRKLADLDEILGGRLSPS